MKLFLKLKILFKEEVQSCLRKLFKNLLKQWKFPGFKKKKKDFKFWSNNCFARREKYEKEPQTFWMSACEIFHYFL